MTIFSVKNLVLGFGHAFHQHPLNFELPKGKLITVLGRNGSGKSTLLEALCGGEGRVSGEVWVNQAERPVHELAPLELSQHIAYVPQEHLYPSHFRVVDLLGMARLKAVGFWKNLPDAADPEIAKVAEKLQVTELLNKDLGKISAGERQRAFLARAVLQKPAVLVLDEPTNHLDPKGIEDLWTVIVEILHTEKLSLVMSTHDLQFVEAYADHVVALKKGDLLFNGSKEKYLKDGMAEKIYGVKSRTKV